MKIAVLLSGGVDSSVALRLVQARATTQAITAFYLKIWLEEELAFLGDCPWEEDLRNARAVCEQAGVALQIVSLQSEYQERIVAHVLAELRRGHTPSPDILCNQQIKFGLFLERIGTEYDQIVSGHYAQVIRQDGRFLLKRSPDPVKDQTYFLSSITQAQLSRLEFPIGHLHKHQVRALAEEFDLPNRHRKDSQGICFLGKIKYLEFVRFHLGDQPGDIVDIETGKRLGEHRGLWFHTIGQRKGLGLGAGPWYVVAKEMKTNRLWVAHSESYLRHARDRFTVGPVHWIAGPPASESLQVKVRHSPQIVPCRLLPRLDDHWEVFLAHKDQGIAPGQSAVFYQDEICLGGGVIELDNMNEIDLRKA